MPTYPTYKFTDIASLIRGVSYDKSVVSTSEREGYIPILRANNIQKDLILNDLVYVPSDFVKEEQMIRNGDIVLAMSSGSKDLVGKSAQANKDINAAFGTFCGLIRAKENIDSKFLGLYFQTQEYRNFVSYQSQGVNICNLKKKDIESLQIPLPPLATQHAIVTRIEILFAELDKAVRHLRTAQQQLKTYRQAVLKAAFEGCENAEKHLFGELMADVRNGYGAKPTDCGTNKLLRISSVRAMNLNLDDFRFNNSSFDERNIIQENDLLFTRYNGSVDLVGVCAYVPELYDTYAYPDKIIRFRPKVCNTFHSKFLQYYINQGKAREFVRSKIKTTSGQNGISGSDIKKIEIPLPTLTEQQRIVKEIESRLSQATASETYIENALQQAEALRQSILKKAFSGELVR